jgi:hypothetical protein
MQNLTVHLAHPTPLSSRAGPRAPALSTAPLTGRPHLSVAPPPGTVLRPTRQAPLSPLCPAGTRARRKSSASATLGPLPGDDHRSGPGPTAPPRRVAPPRPGPPPFSLLFPLCRAAAEPLALLHSFPHPHSSPTPSLERPSFPTAPHTWTATGDHRQPPLPHGFRLSTAAVRHSPVSSSPSYQSLKFLTNPSLP